jgi:hypothetical protein
MIAVELRHLEYFVAVAAKLNFSRATKRMHVVQSALSAPRRLTASIHIGQFTAFTWRVVQLHPRLNPKL